jgi:hypothetical protein
MDFKCNFLQIYGWAIIEVFWGPKMAEIAFFENIFEDFAQTYFEKSGFFSEICSFRPLLIVSHDFFPKKSKLENLSLGYNTGYMDENPIPTIFSKKPRLFHFLHQTSPTNCADYKNTNF